MKEQEQKKETENKKPLSGTEEKSALEKAADTIARDNKLMGVALKLLLSPLTMVIGLGGVIYCLFKIKALSTEVEKLKAENKTLIDGKESQEEEYHKLKKKYKKMKELTETANGNNLSTLGIVPFQALPTEPIKKKTYNTAFLD